MRFIEPIDAETESELIRLENNAKCSRVRNRAKAIRLSSLGYRIEQLSEIFSIHRNTISEWFNHWEKSKFEGLTDNQKTGRKPIIPESEYDTVISFVQENPRNSKKVLEQIEEHFKKSISSYTLRRILKKKNFSWRRSRKSLKGRRNDERFKEAQKIIRSFEQQENESQLRVFYFDETGFSLTSEVPYAWQPVGETIEIPCSKSERVNVLGFLSRSNDFHPYMFEGSIDTDTVIACFESFVRTIQSATVVIIDNASTHTSKKFRERLPDWKEKGLRLYYLPKYSPELNKIEILWRFIKYNWLPVKAYKSFQNLKVTLEKVLKNIGQEYKITFA